MKLNVHTGEQIRQINVPDDMIGEAESILRKMDTDMDKGMQMSRVWVDKLTPEQRCQVVADRLLTALEGDNEPSAMLMAAYIMTRLPGIEAVYLDMDGDITETQFDFG